MNLSTVKGDRLAVLRRLIAEAGTAEVLTLLSDLARQHAEDLMKQGARVDAGRFAREARILAKTADAMMD